MEHNNKTHNQILLKNKNWAIKKKKKKNPIIQLVKKANKPQ